jgi:hypothetical protein
MCNPQNLKDALIKANDKRSNMSSVTIVGMAIVLLCATSASGTELVYVDEDINASRCVAH